MKLHLPLGIRSAVMASLAFVSGFSATLSTGALVGGAFAVTLSAASMAEAALPSVTWDANWDVTTPANVPDADNFANAQTGLADEYMYDKHEGGVTTYYTAVNLTGGGGEAADVFGGKVEFPSALDSWIAVSDGEWNLVVGGNSANNWNRNEKADFTGDSHIQMMDGTVNYIIGGNWKDGYTAQFTGSTYISIMGGDVLGSVVGAGTSAHAATNTVKGDTHVWVYVPLSRNEAASQGYFPNNFVAGGGAAEANATPRVNVDGNTYVTIDFSNYAAGSGLPMNKQIIGASWLRASTTTTIGGSTNVTINGANVNFDQLVIGGSYFNENSGTSTINGGANLTITSGRMNNYVMAGSYMNAAGGSSFIHEGTHLTIEGGTLSNLVAAGSIMNAAGGANTINGGTNLTITGGKLTNHVTAGSYTRSSAGESKIYGGIDFEITGGTFSSTGFVAAAGIFAGTGGTQSVNDGDINVLVGGDAIIKSTLTGGFYIAGTGAAASTQNITLTVTDNATVKDIYGASYSRSTNGNNYNHGDVTINLEGGTVAGDVYAGGHQESGASITVANLEVNISSSVVFSKENALVSGWFEGDNLANTCTGASTLVLADTKGYKNIAGVHFADFDVVEVATDITLPSFSTMKSAFTKSGEGALTLAEGADLQNVRKLTVADGTLHLDKAALTTALKELNINSSGLLVADTLTFEASAAMNLDLAGFSSDEAMVKVGSLAGMESHLDLTLTGWEDAAIGDNRLLEWKDGTELSLDQVSWVVTDAQGKETPLGDDKHELVMEGNALILRVNDKEAWHWNGTEASVWTADESGAGAWLDDGVAATTTPDGEVLYFDAQEGPVTVTIDGDVSPAEAYILKHGEYEFTGDGKITGASVLDVQLDSKLTLSNKGNDYTGDTLVRGTLVLAAEDAVTASTIILRGEDAVLDMQAPNANAKIQFSGGKLVYGADETRNLNTLSVDDGMQARIEVGADKVATLVGSGTATALKGFEITGKGVLQFASGTASLTLDVPLTGDGTVGFASAPSAADAIVVSGDNSGFEGTMLLKGTDSEPVTHPSVTFEGDSAMGAGTALLEGQAFAVKAADAAPETVVSNGAAIQVTADTTQFTTQGDLQATFEGTVTGDATWNLQGDESHTNILSGDYSAFTGTLAATAEGNGTQLVWQLTGENSIVQANLDGTATSTDSTVQFQFSCENAVTHSGAVTGAAELHQLGAGVLTLTGQNTTTGQLYVEDDSVVRLGAAGTQASWAGTELGGTGDVVLVNAKFDNPLTSVTTSVSVQAAANGNIDLGGTDAAVISGPISLAAGSTLTGLTGNIVVGNNNVPGLSLTMTTANLGDTGTAMIQFDNPAASTLTADVSRFSLDLSDTDLHLALLKETGETTLHVTNGALSFVGNLDKLAITPVLQSLGLRLLGTDGAGALVLSGAPVGIYKVMADGSGEPDTVQDYGSLSLYQATYVDKGQTLTVELPGELVVGGEVFGATVNNLMGAASGDAEKPTTFVVSNSNTASGVARLVLNNSEQTFAATPEVAGAAGPDTTFNGAVIGGKGVEIVKDGTGTLTVTDYMQADKLVLQQGHLLLKNTGAKDSSVGALRLNGEDASATLELLAGDTAVSSLADAAHGGTVWLGKDATLTLRSSGMGILRNSGIEGPGTVSIEKGAELVLADAAKLSGTALDLAGTLDVGSTAASSVASLAGTGTLKGKDGALAVTTGGSFGGSLSGSGTLVLTPQASLEFTNSYSGSKSWTLDNNGNATFNLVNADAANSTMVLGTLAMRSGSRTSLVLDTDYGMNTVSLGTLVVGAGSELNLDSASAEEVLLQNTYTLGEVESLTGSLSGATLSLSGYAFLLAVPGQSTLSVEGGKLVLHLALSGSNRFAPLADNVNSATGADIMWDALLNGAGTRGSDIQKVTAALSGYAGMGDGAVDAAAANKLMAAVAGAGIVGTGAAAMGDVDRQLRAIRNRMTTMGVDQSIDEAQLPYVNAWINAEGDTRDQSADGQLAGYTLSSWGGTVGMDVDVSSHLTFGFAATAMYGDYSADSADSVEGDLDSYYLSAFARVTQRAWVHSFVATVGTHDVSLDRTVNYGSGSYKTSGDMEGASFGLMYEVGRTFALNEDASTCWQPVFNVTYRHVGLDGYTETGSDAALRVGDQALDMLTFGLGARLQTAFGENIYNRTSLFEARALLKFDSGDSASETDVAFASLPGRTGQVESAEMGAFGVELGAGFSIPVGVDSGSFFFDASVEVRADYTNFNGTVGYRINF